MTHERVVTTEQFKTIDGFLVQAQGDLDTFLDTGKGHHVVAIAWQAIEDARFELHRLKTGARRTEVDEREELDGRAYVAELEARLVKAETVVVDGTKHRMGSGPWLREGHCSCWACSKARLSNGPR